MEHTKINISNNNNMETSCVLNYEHSNKITNIDYQELQHKFKCIKTTIQDVFIKEEKYTNAKLSDWFLLENSYESNLITDIKDVEYTTYKTAENKNLVPITPLFCDNVTLFNLVPLEHIEKKNSKDMYNKTYTSSGNKLIRQVLRENNIKVVGHSVQCKMVVKYLVEKKKAINPLIAKQEMKFLNWIISNK